MRALGARLERQYWRLILACVSQKRKVEFFDPSPIQAYRPSSQTFAAWAGFYIFGPPVIFLFFLFNLALSTQPFFSFCLCRF